jgi:hypothetical protein
MDINADFNVNLAGNQLPVVHKKEDVAGSEAKIAAKAKEAKEENRVKPEKPEKILIMELEDVRNFLYMLIGADLKVKDNDKFIGDTLNLRA